MNNKKMLFQTIGLFLADVVEDDELLESLNENELDTLNSAVSNLESLEQSLNDFLNGEHIVLEEHTEWAVAADLTFEVHGPGVVEDEWGTVNDEIALLIMPSDSAMVVEGSIIEISRALLQALSVVSEFDNSTLKKNN